MVIVTHIWQKLSSVEREVTFIVTDFCQLFSQIFGETSLIVTHIWPNPTCFIKSCNLTLLVQDSIDICHREGKWLVILPHFRSQKPVSHL
jgi:hypothetical protein